MGWDGMGCIVGAGEIWDLGFGFGTEKRGAGVCMYLLYRGFVVWKNARIFFRKCCCCLCVCVEKGGLFSFATGYS